MAEELVRTVWRLADLHEEDDGAHDDKEELVQVLFKLLVPRLQARQPHHQLTNQIKRFSLLINHIIFTHKIFKHVLGK